MRSRSTDRSIRKWPILTAVAAVTCMTGLSLAVSFEDEPINYNSPEVNDPIARLQKKLDKGQAKFQYDDRHGYLPAVLEALDVPIASQVMVFSKTSFQRDHIHPRTPRVIYFNDDVYIGSVLGGDVVEMSAVDPGKGAIFYSLSQEKTDKPVFLRQIDQCLQCHASSLTRNIPGHLVRSVFPDTNGLPILSAGTHRTTHDSPLAERWGGWYVTGTHGKQRHMGNVMVRNKANPRDLDLEAGANLTDLSKRINTSPYLTDTSDIVALMILEHQVRMHNLITEANYKTRSALHDQAIIDSMLERPREGQSDSTKARILSAGERLLSYMLFSKEVKLTDPIIGSPAFVEAFTAKGPRDRKGRSLRDLDMTRRMFKYPCSYLIYSDAFNGLPEEMKDFVYRRLWEILTNKDHSEAYPHLSREDRQAIREILLETKSGLPPYWKRG